MTTPNVFLGMGLEELLLYQNQPGLFSALTSDVTEQIQASLNPNIPGGISEMIARAETAPFAERERLVDAVDAQIRALIDQVEAVITSDLQAQEAARSIASSDTLIDSIVPEDGEQLSPLIDLVATDTFRQIIA